MSVLISGSIALDHVKTPKDEQADLLGGSASYAAVAASIFSPVNLCGIVGHDFPKEHLDFFESRKIALDGLQKSDGETFRWSGEYFTDMNTRETREVALNVLEEWAPKIPETFLASRIVLLANDHPANQISVLDQMGEGPVFTIADTMDLWIDIAREPLNDLLKRIDLIVMNDGEARDLLGTTNLIEGGRKLLEAGPKFAVIKKGEHGALVFGPDGQFFTCGAYPLDSVYDPTGAGDSFIGSAAGYLNNLGKEEITFEDVVRSVVRGTIIAGYTCESFSTHRLQSLTFDEFETRLAKFAEYSAFS